MVQGAYVSEIDAFSNQSMIHPIKSSDNSTHMIPSPYTPSNPQIITQQITPHPSTSTHLVLHQSTAPKPTRIPLALKHLASQNKPSLQEP